MSTIKIIVGPPNVEISKGYGFINCENKKTYQRIMETKTHEVRGRVVEVNRALSKNSEVPSDIRSKGLRKLFVGGLAPKTEKEELISYFSQFGHVLNSYLIFDPQTKVSKNFGYIEFEDLDVAEYVLNINDHMIRGKKVTVEYHKNGINSTMNFEKRDNAQKKKGGGAVTGQSSSLIREDLGDQYSKLSKKWPTQVQTTALNSFSEHPQANAQALSVRWIKQKPTAQSSLVQAQASAIIDRKASSQEQKLTTGNHLLSSAPEIHAFQQHLLVMDRHRALQLHYSNSENYSFNLYRPSASSAISSWIAPL